MPPRLCLPVVTAMLNPDASPGFDDIDLQHTLAEDRWYVSGYQMSYKNPNTEVKEPLFTDQPMHQTMFRVVVKANLTKDMISHLIRTFKHALKTLSEEVIHVQKILKGTSEGKQTVSPEGGKVSILKRMKSKKNQHPNLTVC